MDTKNCPSCGAEVPASASRCRHCFHDFTAAPPRRSGGMLALLGAIAGMSVVGVVTFWWLSQQPTDTQILVDGSSRTVQWVQQFQDGRLATDRVSFDEVVKVEYRIGRMGDNEISVILGNAERKVVESKRNQGLQLKAEEYARVIGKPLEVRDETDAATAPR